MWGVIQTKSQRAPISLIESVHSEATLRMGYKLKYETPSVDDYIQIRLAAGLSRKSIEAAKIGLSNSLCSVIIYDGEVPIGIGRVIGDGGCFFEIVDIAVKPEYQKQGLGDKIMESLMTYIYEKAPDTAYVSLMADHGTPEFYARFGFEASLPPEKSGMSLRINRIS